MSIQEDPTLPLGEEQMQILQQAPARAGWGGFNLLARVGSGGFGEVYRAWDPSLQREVALKLLLPGAADSEAEYGTILREARALASVRHTNIVSIYGIDRHDGRVGFWTDFVRGKTLSALLGEQGPFGYREASLIGIDVTRALSAVHRAGLLHRDIKPENVMREEGGRILLMDFGLSSLPHHTSRMAGTPNYMAPELFRGEPASVASDIYAVGVLLYFLVTGTQPAKLSGLTRLEAVEACTRRRALTDLRPDLPESFVRVVNRAIDLDPAKRFGSAGEMAEALVEGLGGAALDASPPRVKGRAQLAAGIAIAVVVVAAVIAIATRARQARAVHPATTSKVATGAPAAPTDYESYSQAQALLLKSYKEANVVAAANQFQQILNRNPTFALAAAGLGTAHLILYFFRQDPKLLDAATADVNRALSLDPDCVPADVTLARIAAIQGHTELARDLAQKALTLDPTSADAHRAMADVYKAKGLSADAIGEMKRAIDLAPDDWRFPMTLGSYYASTGRLQDAAEQYKHSAALAEDNKSAYYNLGLVDMRMNRLEDARINITRALQIEPDADAYQELAWLLIAEGKDADAVAADRHAIELAPGSYSVWANLGAALSQTPSGDAEALSAYRKAIALAEPERQKQPRNAELVASLAYYYARVHDVDRSQTLLRQALALAPENPKVNYFAGETYEILGDRAQAIDFIARSVGPGYSMEEINRDPDLRGLRADPAFQARMRAAQIAAKNAGSAAR
jgi:serine/threonine-protein kinase